MIFALTIAAVAFCALILLRQRRRDRAARKSDAHEVYVLALKEWLDDENIVDAMRRNGFWESYIIRMRWLAGRPGMSEPEARAFVAKILENRTVRRVVAAHMAKRHGLDRKRTMANMGKMLESVRS